MRRALGLVGAGPFLVIGGLMLWVRRPGATGQGRAVEQPVRFDHRIHARGLGIDCRFCHAGSERAGPAGIPPTSACVPCHNPVWLASEEFAPVRASLASGRPIPWRRVHRLPDFVFFSHAAHLQAGYRCAYCHGAVESMAVVRQVAPLTMAWCVDCHRSAAPPRRRLTHCTACHR